MNAVEQLSMASNVCDAFKSVYGGCTVRFGRVTKLSTQFTGKIVNITWQPSFRKGGGFNILIKYKNQDPKSHKQILKEMLKDYMDCVTKHGQLKTVKTITTNPTKDLQIYVHKEWINLGILFPIEVREIKSLEKCQKWINTLSTNIDSQDSQDSPPKSNITTTVKIDNDIILFYKILKEVYYSQVVNIHQ